MKREKIYQLEFIKIVAFIAVFAVHFIVEMSYNGIGYDKQLYSEYFLGTYLGDLGVTLFFIASGFALMYVYNEKFKITDYIKKRVMGIYPSFWICFLLTSIISFFIDRGIRQGIPKWKIIYSFLGIDGLFMNIEFSPNFYQIGEWFLGVIILMYFIFPLLRKGLKGKPFFTSVIVAMAFVLTLIVMKITDSPYNPTIIVTLRLPEFYFGMLFCKYRDKFKIKSAFMGLAAVVGSCFLRMLNLPDNVCLLPFGMGLFTFLYFIFSFIPKNGLTDNITKCTGKYLFPFFLVHHFIINRFQSLFTGMVLSRPNQAMLFVACFVISVFGSVILYHITDKVLIFLNLKKNKSALAS